MHGTFLRASYAPEDGGCGGDDIKTTALDCVEGCQCQCVEGCQCQCMEGCQRWSGFRKPVIAAMRCRSNWNQPVHAGRQAGISTADRVVTVSPGYAWEIQTPEGGWGMEEMLASRAYALNGVLNGIDGSEWSPESDPHLPQRYGRSNFSRGKAANKAALQRELALPERPDVRRRPTAVLLVSGSKHLVKFGVVQCGMRLNDKLCLPFCSGLTGRSIGAQSLTVHAEEGARPGLCVQVPLIGFIGRLDFQKGADLVLAVVPWLMQQDVQLVCLGTGDPGLEARHCSFIVARLIRRSPHLNIVHHVCATPCSIGVDLLRACFSVDIHM